MPAVDSEHVEVWATVEGLRQQEHRESRGVLVEGCCDEQAISCVCSHNKTLGFPELGKEAVPLKSLLIHTQFKPKLATVNLVDDQKLRGRVLEDLLHNGVLPNADGEYNTQRHDEGSEIGAIKDLGGSGYTSHKVACNEGIDIVIEHATNPILLCGRVAEIPLDLICSHVSAQQLSLVWSAQSVVNSCQGDKTSNTLRHL